MAEKIIATSLDWLKWLVAIALVCVAVWGNIYFEEQPFLYRMLGVVAVAVVAGYILLQTASGGSFTTLVKGCRVEMRKVVWPTRQETLQTTFIVFVVVAVITLLLWLFDTIFSWLISLLVG